MLILTVLVAYVLGSVPMGYLVVKALTRQDLRLTGTGRTGGAGALRAAGLPAGLLTGLLDVLKAAAAVWLAAAVLPPSTRPVGMAAAGLAAIIGHSFSAFLKFRGSAGGAPAVGAALAMSPLSLLVVVPVGIAVLLALKVSKLAELAMAVTMLVIFLGLYYFQDAPVNYAWFAAGAVGLLAWQARSILLRRVSALRGR